MTSAEMRENLKSLSAPYAALKKPRRFRPQSHQNEYRRAKRQHEERQLKEAKADELARMVELVKSRKNCNSETTHHMCAHEGYPVFFLRLRVSGGVGSFQWMPRRKCYRLQVTAAVQGRYCPARKSARMVGGGIVISRVRAKFFPRYSWCIEI